MLQPAVDNEGSSSGMVRGDEQVRRERQQKEDEEMARQLAKEESDAEAVRRQKHLEELQNASGHVPGFGSWTSKPRNRYPPGDMRSRVRLPPSTEPKPDERTGPPEGGRGI